MIACDIAIVGGGIIGCAIARELSRYSLRALVVEAANDIACGTTKANGGLIHSGYDPAPGTMKSKVNARGNKLYSAWSKELGFEFKRTGSMVLAFTQSDCAHLQTLLENGRANGVDGLQIIGPKRIHELEPQASPEAIQALYCPHTGIVDPFDVAIAAAENAAANGVEFLLNAPVRCIEQQNDSFVLHTPKGNISAKWLINAAGCYADTISNMAGGEHFAIGWRQGNLLVLDKNATAESIMPIYPVPTPTTKGVVVIGTVHGNVLIGSTAVMREKGDLSCYATDIDELMAGATKLVPSLDVRSSIRQFAGGRAVITDTNDFFIGQSKLQPRLFQAAGIQSPGVASARPSRNIWSSAFATQEFPCPKTHISTPFVMHRKISTLLPPSIKTSSSRAIPHGDALFAAAKRSLKQKSSPPSIVRLALLLSRGSSAVAVPEWAVAKVVFAKVASWTFCPASWV